MKINVTLTKHEAAGLLVDKLRERYEFDASIDVTITDDPKPFYTPVSPYGILSHPPAAGVVDALNRGNLIEAVKLMRQGFGYSLVDAKNYCEMYRYVVLGGPKPTCME